MPFDTISLVDGGIVMPYFTIEKTFLFPSFDLPKKEKEKLDKFLLILEKSDVASIIQKEKESKDTRGRKPYNPFRMFATIIYAFSIHSGSVRKIEESVNFDLRFIYLMEQERPSYVAFSEFLNNIFVKHHREIYSKILTTILDEYSIDISDCFLDGTKFEANANKYKFVWRPTNFHKKLDIKVKALLGEYFEIKETNILKSDAIAVYLSSFYELLKKDGIEIETIVTGKGHKIPKLAKDYFLLKNYLVKTLEYEEDEKICGKYRNSFYKTDKDATAMCLKEDYYSGLGSNMHAGYNAQLIVSKGMILTYYVGQERNDLHEFIPTIQEFYKTFGKFPSNLCADAGYGSYSNYQYLSDHNINNFVKYQSWRQEIDGTSVQLYTFDENKHLICLNGKIAKEFDYLNGRHAKGKRNKFYKIENCRRCAYKDVCRKQLKDKKGNERVFETSFELWNFKEEARKNLLSPKGIEMRVNRSAQSEGTFGIIKQDINFERFRRRGLENVSTELMLVCLGCVIRKVFTIMDGKGKMNYWIAPDNLQAEEIKVRKTLKKVKNKGKNEKLRKSYKRANKKSR